LRRLRHVVTGCCGAAARGGDHFHYSFRQWQISVDHQYMRACPSEQDRGGAAIADSMVHSAAIGDDRNLSD